MFIITSRILLSFERVSDANFLKSIFKFSVFFQCYEKYFFRTLKKGEKIWNSIRWKELEEVLGWIQEEHIKIF